MKFICKHCKTEYKTAGTIAKHEMICNWTKDDLDDIKHLYFSGILFKDINKKYSKSAINCALRGNRLNKFDRQKLIRENNDHAHKWNNNAKLRWSQKCKRLHADNRMNTWQNHKSSYAEKAFLKFLEDLGYQNDNDFLMEFPFSIYRADFYFPKLAIVIEIDGKQHRRYKQRQVSDRKKDKLIQSKGIKVLRISWQAMCYDSRSQYKKIKNILNNKKNIDILIAKFTKCQLKRLNKLDDLEDLKKINKRNRELARQSFRLERLATIENINPDDYGNLKKIAELWGVSNTQARRYINKLQQ